MHLEHVCHPPDAVLHPNRILLLSFAAQTLKHVMSCFRAGVDTIILNPLKHLRSPCMMCSAAGGFWHMCSGSWAATRQHQILKGPATRYCAVQRSMRSASMTPTWLPRLPCPCHLDQQRVSPAADFHDLCLQLLVPAALGALLLHFSQHESPYLMVRLPGTSPRASTLSSQLKLLR